MQCYNFGTANNIIILWCFNVISDDERICGLIYIIVCISTNSEKLQNRSISFLIFLCDDRKFRINFVSSARGVQQYIFML